MVNRLKYFRIRSQFCRGIRSWSSKILTLFLILSLLKTHFLHLKSFFPWSMCSPMKGFHLIVSLRYNQRPAKFSILTLQCAGWLLGCEAHRGVLLSGEMHTAEYDSAARCRPRSLTQRLDAHRGVWLSGETHTTESDSAARCTVHTAESDSAVRCTPRSLSFLKNRRPRWNRNWIKTILSRLTGIHMGSNY